MFGAVALGIVLLNDLPASNETGVIGRDFAGAKAEPGAGLYLEAAGGLLAMVAARGGAASGAAHARERQTAAG